MFLPKVLYLEALPPSPLVPFLLIDMLWILPVALFAIRMTTPLITFCLTARLLGLCGTFLVLSFLLFMVLAETPPVGFVSPYATRI